MATDVEVQFFSHLNGLVLGNNWGDMVRLLDSCLVNGLPLSSVTSAVVNNQGDITLNLYADHKSLLFQIVELSGFEPTEINGKYRIKGTPTTTQLILKAAHAGKTVTKIGTAKLASLGYDIIFRDGADVKRVYRAKNHRTEHPFIRVDETISDGVNSYTSTYAKSAMVGLLENMTHIDDYQDTSKMQLPLDTNDFSKNWKINGTGTSVIRGWCKWYWAMQSGGWNTSSDSTPPTNGNRSFTLIGSVDAFYLLNQTDLGNVSRHLNGCGLFNTALKNDVIPNWFLMGFEKFVAASAATNRPSTKTGTPLMRYSGSQLTSNFFIPKYSELTRISDKTYAIPILPSNYSGADNLYPGSNVPALEIPFYDEQSYLRGALIHVCYSGKNLSPTGTTAVLSDNSMYIYDIASYGSSSNGMFYFYLGELE